MSDEANKVTTTTQQGQVRPRQSYVPTNDFCDDDDDDDDIEEDRYGVGNKKICHRINGDIPKRNNVVYKKKSNQENGN